MQSEKDLREIRKALNESDKNTAALFKVLSDVNRYRIFRLLSEQPMLSVGNIAEILSISLPLASQHIKILSHSNLIQKERGGKKVLTKLKKDNPFVPAIIKTIQALKKE